ncbi:FAD-dependent oxidoreductase [Candidatus Bipolaricaulota bacterium]
MSRGGKQDVLVVGAGIAGLQSSLLLAEKGHHVWLLERAPAIGGFFPLLDRTFPTNSCGVCFMSPSPPAFCPIYESEFHENITLLPHSELRAVTGEQGDFSVSYTKNPTFVDPLRCTLCDECSKVCPVEVDREFGAGLETRKAIHLPFPQAIPRSYIIDSENCTRCGACVDACPVNAVDLDAKANEDTLNVGAIILGFGFEPFRGENKGEYGLGRYDNVLSSVQYERMLSLSSPTSGLPKRLSDGEAAKRVAFIQCVGSRDIACGQGYCSTICCMYATKQAMLSRARTPELEATIFYMDMRPMGKGYERYYERAKNEYGIRYVRSSVSALRELKQTRDLRIRSAQDDGTLNDEDFDLVVLSLGFTPPGSVVETAKLLDVELNDDGFCRTEPFNPTQTSRPGIFVAGAFRQPMDIPETVVEASAAASRVSALVSPQDAVAKAVTEPSEADSEQSDETSSVAVFFCDSKGMLRAGIALDELIVTARANGAVSHVEEIDATVLREGAEKIAERITEQRLNRVVLAGYRTMSLKNALRRMPGNEAAGCLIEYTSIGEQCVSVHSENPEAAFLAAGGQLRAAVRKASLATQQPAIWRSLESRVLVIGGGVAGLTSALSLAEQGNPVTLVEASEKLGGNALQAHYSIDGSSVQPYLTDLIERASAHPEIEIMTQSTLQDHSGTWGAFQSTITTSGEETIIDHGAIVFAVGGAETVPEEYLYGEHPNVITQRTLEQMLADNDAKATEAKTIVMVQCVGSRDENRPYCSHVCCTHAVKNALRVKELNPEATVVVLYRDVRTYGPNEEYYLKARELGVLFVRYDTDEKPVVASEGESLSVTFRDPVAVDSLALDVDLVVLSVGIQPNEQMSELANIANIDLDEDGFFAEANPKSAPLDAVDRGKYFCGLCHSPLHIDEAILQGRAVAARASALLWRGMAELADNLATVNERRCAGCGLCVSACPYEARAIDEFSGKAIVLVELCKGCGTCVVTCPNAASQQESYERATVMDILDEVMT